ncbi:hypothetical protein B0H14DRAFT_3437604 [Mycena olivaceomarginata]|nr:hypothetical protein B0H14DRAFT_3437604 [Mycena olivaceomarginata]
MHKIKAQENLSCVLVPLSAMDALKIPEIHEQLNAYRARGVPDLLVNSKYPRRAEKLAALKDVFRWFEANGTLQRFLRSLRAFNVGPGVAEERCDEEERHNRI